MATTPVTPKTGTQAEREKEARSREQHPNVNPTGDARERDTRDRAKANDRANRSQTEATGGDATPAHAQTAYSPVDTSTGEPKAVGGEDTVQAGVLGSDPQVVDFDLDPEVKEQLDNGGSYIPPMSELGRADGPSGEAVPRSLSDPGVGQKPYSGHLGAGPDVISEPNAKSDASQPKSTEPVSKEAGKAAVHEPSTKTPEHRK